MAMWIEAYTVRPTTARSGFRFTMRVEGQTYQAVSDDRMGSVMAAQRELIRRMAADHGQVIAVDPVVRTGPIGFDTIICERSVTQPGYRVEIVSGVYTFTAYMDPTLDSFLAMWGGAMKFFAAQYGIVWLYDDGAYHPDAAREIGRS